MTRTTEDANRAIMRVREMPFGVARNEVAAALVREISAEGPEDARAFALFSLVESYAFSEEVEKAYLPFTQSVRLWDERPELFDAQDVHSLFWSFKWMVSNLMSYPTIPAEQISATIEDMERRYRLAGNGLSAVNHLRFEWHHLLGDASLPSTYETWVTTERDDFSQCPACEPGDRTAYLFEEGRWAEGIRLLENAQEAGEECRTEPADMLSQLQLAYLEVGDAEGAARAHRRGLRTLDTSGEMCGAHGRHIQFLARSGNTATALRFLLRYQRLLTRTESPQGRWSFLTTAGVGVAALRAQDPDRAISLEEVPATTLAELDDWMRAQALAVAADFDRRGGTRAMTERTLRAWSGEQVHLPVNLSVLDAVSPGGPSAPAPSGAPTQPGGTGAGIGPDALVDQAERLAAEDPVAAARLYAQASAAFAAQGLEEPAGFALAEAAALSDQLGDLDGAAETAATALGLLRSAETSTEYVGPVARTAARLLSLRGEDDRAAALLTDVLVTAESDHADARSAHEQAAAVDLAGAAQASTEGSVHLAQRVRNLTVELAQLLDTRARVLASAGDPEAAVADARRAAQEFAGCDLVRDAAHAFWLAGTVEHGAGRSAEAVWFLESASEGFELVRAREQHAEVTGELIEVLTGLGRTQEAESLVQRLAR